VRPGRSSYANPAQQQALRSGPPQKATLRTIQTSARTPPVLVPASNALARQILARDETDPKPGPPRTLILFEENEASSEQYALKAQTSGTRNEKGELLDSHRNRARLLNRTTPNSVIANVRTRTPVGLHPGVVLTASD
jgi:hypothetical protein